jgi:hypothetical protein
LCVLKLGRCTRIRTTGLEQSGLEQLLGFPPVSTFFWFGTVFLFSNVLPVLEEENIQSIKALLLCVVDDADDDAVVVVDDDDVVVKST